MPTNTTRPRTPSPIPGLVVAGNNPTIGTSGVNDSTLNGRQWGVGPRIGIVWSPPMLKNVVVRAGYGIFYDRGEYFSELSPSAGAGVNGPFGVTVAAPFVQKVSSDLARNPFAAVPRLRPFPPMLLTRLCSPD